MVTCKLYGRMANQMFQIAATIGYAKKHNREYHIPKTTINETVWEARFKHLVNPNFPAGGGAVLIKEKQHSYYELPHNPDVAKVTLDGYWQSQKYFEHCMEDVRKAFPFDYNRVMYNTVGLHVRLGDYKDLTQHHPTVTKEYIKKALHKVLGETGCKQVIIMSDEPALAKSLLETRLYPGVLFSLAATPDRTDTKDFQTMLECEHLIISNSTFSLMAGMLSTQPNKMVVSPSKSNWFGPANAHLDTSTIIPDTFTQIKY